MMLTFSNKQHLKFVEPVLNWENNLLPWFQSLNGQKLWNSKTVVNLPAHLVEKQFLVENA